MKLLAIVPARGGSKRLPMKNKRILKDKPLISWTLDFAKRLSGVENIIVSTDDKDIIEIAKKSGVLAPWLRPQSLSSDLASSIDVVIHALDWYEDNYGAVDGVIMLQPTSPFRNLEAVTRAIEEFKSDKTCSIIGVNEIRDHPYWTLGINDQGALSPLMGVEKFSTQSQLLPKFYIVNGSFYLASPKDLKENNGFISDKTRPLISQYPEESIDIDDESDWAEAEKYLESFNE